MLLLFMIFMHIVDDYYLQGVLAKLKQKDWWKENAPEQLCKYDYIVALLIHSFSWAFLIMLPINIYNSFDANYVFILTLFANCFIHMFVDDLKANKKKINLIVDQTTHLLQITMTFGVFMMNGFNI